MATKLTDRIAKEAPAPDKGLAITWDEEVRGFVRERYLYRMGGGGAEYYYS
jgi:hypothetical protein